MLKGVLPRTVCNPGFCFILSGRNAASRVYGLVTFQSPDVLRRDFRKSSACNPIVQRSSMPTVTTSNDSKVCPVEKTLALRMGTDLVGGGC